MLLSILDQFKVELLIEVMPQIVAAAVALCIGAYYYLKSNKRDDGGYTEGEESYLGSVEAKMRREVETLPKKPAYDPKNGEDNEWVILVSDEDIEKVYGEIDEEKCTARLEYLRKKYVFDLGDYEGKSSYAGYGTSGRLNAGYNTGLNDLVLGRSATGIDSARRKMENSRRMFEGVYADVIINSAIRYYFGDRAEYKKTYGIPFAEFQSIYFGLYGRQLNLATGNFKAEDLIKGVFNGHNFRQSDIRLTEKEGNRDICGRVMTLEGDYPVGFGLYIGLRDSEREVNNDDADFVDYITGNSDFDSKYFVKTRDEFYASGFLTEEMMRGLIDLEVGGDLLLYYTSDMLWVFRDRVRGMFESGENEPIDVMTERRYTCLAFMEAKSIMEAAAGIAAEKEERGFDIYGEADVEAGEYALSGAGSDGELQTGR